MRQNERQRISGIHGCADGRDARGHRRDQGGHVHAQGPERAAVRNDRTKCARDCIQQRGYQCAQRTSYR